MHFPRLLSVVCLLAGAALLQAQDHPYVKKPLRPVNINRGGTSPTVSLDGVFGVNNVNGPLVKFTFNSTHPAMYLELYPDITPKTVANFRRYINDGRYDKTFIHRSEPNFVLQGGGYYHTPYPYNHIPTYSPIENEFKLSNLPGTIAMAKLGGDLNSATSEWYFNLANNSFLDAPDQKFTVFGRLIYQGLAAAQQINRLPVANRNTSPNGPFARVPFTTIDNKNYEVRLEDAADLPFLKLTSGANGYLRISAGSSNAAVVKAELTSSGLKLTTGSGVGSATITVRATDPFGRAVETKFVASSVNPNLPTVGIVLVQPDTREGSTTPGRVRLTRTGSLTNKLPVTLNFAGSTAANGTDLKPVSTVATIPAGAASVDVAVTSINDTVLEGIERFAVTVSPSSAYNITPVRTASVVITDNDVPSVGMAILDAVATERTTDKAVVRFTRSGSTAASLAVALQFSGNAEAVKDFTPSPASFTIPAGQTTANLTIAAVADNVKEAAESIVLKAAPSRSYNAPVNELAIKLQNAP